MQCVAKTKWLIEMMSDEKLASNLSIFTRLIGHQKGCIEGRDLMFLQKSYFKRHLLIKSDFYKEGLLSLGNVEIRKGIPNLNHWDKEHIFFNPLFTRQNGEPGTVIIEI